MPFNGIFDFASFTDFDNNNFGHNSSSAMDHLFDIFNRGGNAGLDLSTDQHAGPSTHDNQWYLNPPCAGGPSQLYAGVEVLGGSNGFPDLDDPTRAPTTLYPTGRVSLNEG